VTGIFSSALTVEVAWGWSERKILATTYGHLYSFSKRMCEIS